MTNEISKIKNSNKIEKDKVVAIYGSASTVKGKGNIQYMMKEWILQNVYW